MDHTKTGMPPGHWDDLLLDAVYESLFEVVKCILSHPDARVIKSCVVRAKRQRSPEMVQLLTLHDSWFGVHS
jgi:hypothetical protein